MPCCAVLRALVVEQALDDDEPERVQLRQLCGVRIGARQHAAVLGRLLEEARLRPHHLAPEDGVHLGGEAALVDARLANEGYHRRREEVCDHRGFCLAGELVECFKDRLAHACALHVDGPRLARAPLSLSLPAHLTILTKRHQHADELRRELRCFRIRCRRPRLSHLRPRLLCHRRRLHHRRLHRLRLLVHRLALVRMGRPLCLQLELRRRRPCRAWRIRVQSSERRAGLAHAR
mmetsp:Transcript_18688/g.42901  ORF Transcript_18688/g.42901 Transcript_18688/m.42901 type:complete len:234 (-) Transcript_18688:181-882(-)